MSIKVMNWAWSQDISNSSRKLVLLALADRANDDGECWPGITSLAEKCSIPRRTLIRALASLEEQGLISVRRRPGEGSGRQTNLYQINFAPSENGQGANLAHSRQGAKNDGAKCQSDTRQSAKNGGAKCQSLAPNTSVEPSVEPSVKESLSAGSDSTTFLTADRVKQAGAQGFTDRAWMEAETVKFLNFTGGKKLRNPTGAWLNWLHKGREYAAAHAPAAKPRKTVTVVAEQTRDPAAYETPAGRFSRPAKPAPAQENSHG